MALAKKSYGECCLDSPPPLTLALRLGPAFPLVGICVKWDCRCVTLLPLMTAAT